MRFTAHLAALLAAATTVLAAPVYNALEARGGAVYDVTSKVIVVTVYVVTQTEHLYEAKCDYDKWKKNCDHKVSRSRQTKKLNCRNSILNLLSMLILWSLRSRKMSSISSASGQCRMSPTNAKIMASDILTIPKVQISFSKKKEANLRQLLLGLV